MRIWTQTLIPPAITMTLYFVIFGKLIGSRIGTIAGRLHLHAIHRARPGHDEHHHQQLRQHLQLVLRREVQPRVEEMLVSPMPNWVILLGYVTGAVSRGWWSARWCW
jgi:ABC-2 type transport system permease protein